MIPVVFVHGFLGAPALWDPVVERLDERGPAGPSVRWVLPGHCGTAVEAMGFDALVDAMARRLPAQPAVLVGYSMGARVCVALAVRHPRAVRGVFAIGAHPGCASDAERRQRQHQERRWARRLREEGLAAFVSHWESLPLFASQRHCDPSVRRRQRAWRMAHDPRRVAEALVALGRGAMPYLPPLLARCPVPMVFAAGAEDAAFGAVQQDMAHAAPRGCTHLFLGCGHNPVLEDPQAVADAVARFAASLTCAPTPVPEDGGKRR